MANKQIKDLTLRADADETINIPCDDASQTYRVTGAQIKAFIKAALFGDKTLITGQTADTSPSVADSLLSYDASADSLKKVTKANLFKSKMTSVSTTATADAEDDVLLCDATSGAFTVTLPAAASYTGKEFSFKKTDSSSNIVTIDGNGLETIEGKTSIRLCSQYDALTIVSDGANWAITKNQIAVACIITGKLPNSYTADTPFVYPTVTKDPQGNYNNSTGEYIAEFTGFYDVSFALNTDIAANKVINIYVAGILKEPAIGYSYTAAGIVTGAGKCFANAGDKITVRAGGSWTVALSSPSGLSIGYAGRF